MLKTSLLVSMLISAANAESFLTAQSFPKTFEDLSFKSRVEVLTEGYLPYKIEYDENGVCVSGCAYQGITIKDDMKAVAEAGEQMAELIAASEISIDGSGVVISGGGTPGHIVNLDGGIISGGVSDGGIISGGVSEGGVRDWCHNGKSTKLPLRYPVDMTNFKHVITSDFGVRKIEASRYDFHPAIDIGCSVGTPVYATADGVIEAAGFDNKGGGNYINIKHDNGLLTQYMHLSEIQVSKGQHVSACQQIALSGNTGDSSGPHLDYRVRFQGDRNKYVDILCPGKTTDKRSKETVNTSIQNITSEHSLFFNKYKFTPYDPNTNVNKRSLWRVENGHCMTRNTDLLPDEVR